MSSIPTMSNIDITLADHISKVEVPNRGQGVNYFFYSNMENMQNMLYWSIYCGNMDAGHPL